MSDFVSPFHDDVNNIRHFANAIIHSCTPAGREEYLHSAQMALAELDRRRDEVRALGVPKPPPKVSCSAPSRCRDWAIWEWQFRRAIEELTSACHQIIEQANSSAIAVQKCDPNSDAFRAEQLAAVQAFHRRQVEVDEASSRLWQFGADLQAMRTQGIECCTHQAAGETGTGPDSDPAEAEQSEGTGADSDQAEAEQAEGSGEQARQETIAKLTPAVRKAYLAYNAACLRAEKKPDELQDWEAYKLLKEEGIPEDSQGELADYRLPAKDTWCRYLRKARQALDERKYTRRRGRPHGKSIVRADQIERPEDDA